MADELDEIDQLLAEGDDLDLTDPTMDPDNPSTGVVGDFKSAVSSETSAGTLATKLKESLKGTLPGDLGSDIENAERMGGSIIDTISKNAETVSNTAADLVGGLEAVLPDSMSSSLSRVRTWLRPDTASGTREATEDEKIKAEVAGLLGDLPTRESISADIQQSMSSMKDSGNDALLARIAANTEKSVLFKTEIDNNYYRKDLELQIKQTYTLIKMYDLLRKDSEIRGKQVEAIVKNTGLPDFAKARSSDLVKQMIINDGMNATVGAFKSTSVFDKASKGIQSLIDDKVSSFVTTMETTTGLTDMLASTSEMGLSKTELLMSLGIGAGVDKLSDTASEKILESVYKNEKGVTDLNELSKIMSDPSTAFKNLSEEYKEKDLKARTTVDENGIETVAEEGMIGSKDSVLSKLYDGISTITEGGPDTTSYSISNGGLDDVSYFTGKSKETLETIIPGLLSSILSEVTTIRKGDSTVSDKDVLSFDFNKNKFTSKEDGRNEILESINNSGKRLATSVSSSDILETIAGNGLNDKDKAELSKLLITYMLSGKTLSPYYMLDNGFIAEGTSNNLASSITENINKLITPKTREEFDKVKSFQNTLENIREYDISSFSDIAKNTIKSGKTSLLSEIGLVDKDNYSSVASNSIIDLNSKLSEKAIDDIYRTDDVIVGSTRANTSDSMVKKLGTVTRGNNVNVPMPTVDVPEVDIDSIDVGISDLTSKINDKLGSIDIQVDMPEFNIDKIVNKLDPVVDKFVSALDAAVEKSISKIDIPSLTEGVTEKTGNLYENLRGSLDSLMEDSSEYRKDARRYYKKSKIKLQRTFKDANSQFSKYMDNPELLLEDSEEQYLNLMSKLEDQIGADKAGYIFDAVESVRSTGKYIPTSGKELTSILSTIKGSLPKDREELGTAIDDLLVKTGSVKDTTLLSTLALMEDYAPETAAALLDQIDSTDNVLDMLGRGYTSSKKAIGNILPDTPEDNEDKYINLMSKLEDQIGADKAGHVFDAIESMRTTGKYLPTSNAELMTMLSTVKGSLPDDRKELIATIDSVTDKAGSANDTTLLSVLSLMEGFAPETASSILDQIDSTDTTLSALGKGYTISKNAIGEALPDSLTGAYDDVLALMNKVPDIEPSILANMTKMDDIVNNAGMNKVLKMVLEDKALPDNTDEARILYAKAFNTIDPSGGLWDKISTKPGALDSIIKIHGSIIDDNQKSLLGKGIDKATSGAKGALGMIGNLKESIINSLPSYLQGPARSLLENRVTKYVGKQVGRIGKAAKAAAGVTLDELKVIGKEGKDLFIDKDGRLTMPNAVNLAKFAGKSYMGSMKAVGKGVKQLYPEIFGSALDTAKLVGKTAWDVSGIAGGAKRTKNRLKAMIKPPIDRKLYKAWTSGKMTASEVMDVLPEEEKQKWQVWLDENRAPGISLASLMKLGGSWYMSGMKATGKGVKPTYKVLGKGALKVGGFVAKSLWKFSGIPDMFGSSNSTKTIMDLISTDFKDTFIKDVNDLMELVGYSPKVAKLLETDIETFKPKEKESITRTILDLNKLYVKLMSKGTSPALDSITEKITQLLTTLESTIKDETVKPKEKVKSKAKLNDKDTIKKAKSNTIYDTILEGMDDVVENSNSTYESIKEFLDKSAPKEEKTSVFDKDKDGDRDGNFKDRMEKLYSKKDKSKTEKKVESKEEEKSDAFSWISMLGGAIIPIITKFISSPIGAIGDAVWGATKWLSSGLLSGIGKSVWGAMKWLSKGLLGGLGGLLSKIPGLGAGGTLASKMMGSKKPAGAKPTKVKNGLLDKVFDFGKSLKDTITSKFSGKAKGLLDKVIDFGKKLKGAVTNKLSGKAKAMALGKISSKFVPGLGQIMLAYDVGMIGKAMMVDGKGFGSAVSEQILGIDLFREDEEDIPYTDELLGAKTKRAANNGEFNPTKDLGNRADGMEEPAKNISAIKKLDVKASNVNVRSGALYSPDNGDSNISMKDKSKLDGLHPIVSDNFKAMANEYNVITGKTIPVNEAFRSYDDQLALKRKYGNRAASPGNSTHEFGLAIDANTKTLDELDELGLLGKYKFTRPVGGETWHLEPAGIQFDIDRAKQDPAYAGRLINNVPFGGAGWGTKHGVRKYSRSLDYYKDMYRSEPKTVLDNKQEVVNNVAKYKRDTLETEVKNTNVKSSVDSTALGDDVEVKVRDKATTGSKNNIPKVNVINNNDTMGVKELAKHASNSNSTLSNSYKVQSNMDSKLGELIQLNKDILNSLKTNNNNDVPYTNSNNHIKTKRKTSTTVIDHSVSNF